MTNAPIYLAEHVYLKTLRAAKVLYLHIFEEDQRQNFLNEAWTVSIYRGHTACVSSVS